MEVSRIVYVRKKSTSGVGYLTPSQQRTSIKLQNAVTELVVSAVQKVEIAQPVSA